MVAGRLPAQLLTVLLVCTSAKRSYVMWATRWGSDAHGAGRRMRLGSRYSWGTICCAAQVLPSGSLK
jgi:hypothetical protein